MKKENKNRFWVKFQWGNYRVIDRTDDKMVTGYASKSDAEATCSGLNRIRKPSNIPKMIKLLQTTKGYGHYINKK